MALLRNAFQIDNYHICKCLVFPLGPVYDCPPEVKTHEYFEQGMCKELDSTQKVVGSPKLKLCVGHSYELYETMFNHIIQAERFVDITSLDSFDMFGYLHTSGQEFTAAVRNAISYLASTGKRITVRIHFGSVLDSNEVATHIADELWPSNIPQNQIDFHVTTYRKGAVTRKAKIEELSWNHGKIIAVDGDKLFTGGTNYYTSHYLWEDQIHDVNLQVRGSAALTAHRWANRLHKAACELSSGFIPLTFVDYAWRSFDNEVRNDGTPGCPPAFVGKVHHIVDYQSNKSQNSGVTILPMARLGSIASTCYTGKDGCVNDDGNEDDGISRGQKTSDLAMYSMITTADKTVKISQQDMLPVIMYGAASHPKANEGYAVGSDTVFGTVYSTTGIAVFDDTWRLIEATAIAVAKNVKVSILLSAMCAQAAVAPASEEFILGGMEKCPGMSNYTSFFLNSNSFIVNTLFFNHLCTISFNAHTVEWPKRGWDWRERLVFGMPNIIFCGVKHADPYMCSL